LEDLQQAEREMKKLKKEIERMEQERVTAQERLDNIKTLIKGYEKRNAGMCSAEHCCMPFIIEGGAGVGVGLYQCVVQVR
jgi:hypothetical protein